MSRSLGSSWRRTRAVIVATGKDLGRGCMAAAILLLLVWFVSQLNPPQGPGVEGTVRLQVEETVSTSAILAGFAAILVTAWSFGEDRRTRRMQLWRVSPLRSPEFVVGRVLGLWLGTCALVLPLHLVMLFGWPGTLAAHGGLLRPVAQGLPTEVGQGAVVLQSREARTFQFPGLPGARAVTVTLVPVGYDRGQEKDRPPRLLVREGERLLVAADLPELPGIAATVDLPQPTSADLEVTLEAGHHQGRLLLRPGDLRVVGETRSLFVAVQRSLMGLAALVLLLCCVVSVFGLFLSDVLALAVGAVVLLVLMGRGLLLEVTTSVMNMDEHIVSESGRTLAAGLAAWLALVPDGGAIVGARLLALGHAPGSVDDSATWGLLAGWCGISVCVATILFAVRRRRMPS